MANTATDQATSELIDKINNYANKISEIIKAREKKKREEDEYKLSKIDAKQQARLYRDITENYTKDCKKVTYGSSDMKMAQYVKNQLVEYNNEHPKHKISFITSRNEKGQMEILTNQAGIDKCYDFRIKYAIEHSGKVGEIPTDQFESLSKNKHVTILKNLTEEQYNFISRKNWNSKNQISYTALKNPDGTYNIAVISKDYMSYGKNGEDIYTALVAEKLTYDKNRQEADKYEQKMEEKIFSYNGNEPMYIASARNGGQYLKVEKDKVSVMRPDGEDIIIPRPKAKDSLEAQKAFAIDVYSQLDKISEPLIVGSKTKAILTANGQSIEEALDDHARSGDDSDLIIGKTKEGLELYERPIVDNTLSDKTIKKFSQEIAHTFRDNFCSEKASEFTNQYANKYIEVIQKSDLSDMTKESLTKDLTSAIDAKFANIVDDNLGDLSRKQLNEMTKGILTNSRISKDVARLSIEDAHKLAKIADIANKELNKMDMPKLKDSDILKKEISEAMKNDLNKLYVQPEVTVKSLNSYSKEFAKTMQSKEFKPEYIDAAINVAAQTYDMPKESIYINQESELADYLSNNLNASEKANYDKVNYQHDRTAEAKSIAQADKQFGNNDVVRTKDTKYSTHGNIEEREDTEIERSR